MSEMVFPLPVKRCRDKETGELYRIEDADFDKLFAKINEELTKANDEQMMANLAFCNGREAEGEERVERMAEELADTIIAIITVLQEYGYNDKLRGELFAKVNGKNRSRGYLD